MNKYYKNMILCSELDYHCLLCVESFEDIKDVEKHIRWEKHRQSIKNPSYISNYKEFIHKIRDFYYCEVCNSGIKLDALQEHMKTNIHKENKTKHDIVCKKSSLCKRDSLGLIIFPKLIINRLQWHGINKGKCYLCDNMVRNVNDHINFTKHMMNIIQSEVIENHGYYYRKINENLYCFSCANNVNEDAMRKHNCRNKHKETKKDVNKNVLQKKRCESPTMLKIYQDIEKDLYDINIGDSTAKCKLCNVFVDPISKDLYKHRQIYHEDTIKYVDPLDHGKLRSELATYGKKNFIKLNEGGSKGYCSLCNTYISAHIRVAKEHVNGRLHKGHLELKGLIGREKHSMPGYRVQTLQNYLKNMFLAPPLNAFCINFSISLDGLSLMFITSVENEKQPKRKCYCCDMVFNWEDVHEHLNTKKHKDAFIACDILLMDDEFIRVIRPGLFHCGFCNKVFPFWEAMNKHIVTLVHKFTKKKNELACTLALQWYAEHKTNGAIRMSDELYMQLIELGMVN